MDDSKLDSKYFIDSYKYNCPFCKRNHVSYSIVSYGQFNWSEKKLCFFYKIHCSSCELNSIHFSYDDIMDKDYYNRSRDRFIDNIDIDSKIFFSQPSSFFTIDSRIPTQIRDLISEAEKSRKANLLVGASACLRKAIYELLNYEKVIVRDDKTKRANYKKSIESLKNKFSQVTSDLFDNLGQIQELTSDQVHEDSWKAWSSPVLHFLIELTKATLNEIYVIPDDRKKSVNALSKLKNVFSQDKKEEPVKADMNR